MLEDYSTTTINAWTELKQADDVCLSVRRQHALTEMENGKFRLLAILKEQDIFILGEASSSLILKSFFCYSNLSNLVLHITEIKHVFLIYYF